MQNKVSLSLLSLFIIGLQSCSQPTSNKILSINKVVHTIDFDWLEKCETGKGDCGPVMLEREMISDSVRLVFPSGGTSSTVYLYKTPVDKTNPLAKPFLQDHKNAKQGLPSLDLTQLPDGDYLAWMLSCSVGGGFTVTLKTKK